MRTEKRKISDLTPATSLAGFSTIGYKIADGKKTSVQLDLSHVQTAYESTVEATRKANEATGKADKAATDANNTMARISADVSRELTGMRQLEATVEGREEIRENSYTQWQAKEQARQNAEIARQAAAVAQSEAERLRVLREDERNATFNEKAQEAGTQADYAREQGDYAKEQGARVGRYDSRIADLEKNKIDGGYAEDNELILTSGGIPVGDPIPVGSGTGGGGSAGISCKVLAITDTLLSTVSGASVRIGYSFTSVYADDGSETGDGTATYTINSQKVATEAILQGNVYFDVAKWLVVGTNTIKVTVKDSTGQSRSVAYTVEVISMSITDSYDDTQVNTGNITYRYNPVGAIAKTVHFVLDGTEIATKETTGSNRQLSQVIPAQTHGAHRLEVYMTTTVAGAEVRSNTLTHDLICVSEGNNTVIVASSFNQTTARQYDRLSIPFIIYNPAASTSAVTLSVDGVALSEQTVDRTSQKWTYRITRPGALALRIASGGVSRTFNLTVAEAAVIVEPETADLALHLASANRSNNDNNKGEWAFGDIAASLTGFNFKTNGWISENGGTALRVSGDARVAIPYHVFATDFRATGKTIEFEFETRAVIDYDAVVIDCLAGGIGLRITAQEALFKSEQTTVSTRFKEEERVRVSFIVEKKTDNRLVYIYINGVLSGVAQYPNDDNFQQASPVGIMIGSNDCTVDLFNIRVYDNNLTEYQLLDNYIADIDDYDKKITVHDRNHVYTAYGDISYDATLNLVPGLIIIGELPTYKGDKKTVALIYTDKQRPERSFMAYNVQIDVQGTSSQYYPRKNLKLKLRNGLTMSESGEYKDAYPLRPDGIPATVFCTKADFAESSGTHNTGMAVIADKLLKDLNILTPPQKTNDKVRTTIDGFPICIFHRATADSDIEFVGKYNFNYDKGAEETFGFAEGDESWEFCNNTSDRVLFKSADFTGTDWTNDFEARYPDDDAINAEYEAGTRKPTNLMAVMEWVVSTANDTDKFKTGVADHFDLNNLLSYYLFTEIFAMVDQRAKNMFLTRYATDGKWRFILYDNDTCLGINNEGLISFGYNVEYHDKIGTLNVWNGEGSVLWKNVETCFLPEIESMYKDIRSKGYLSYDCVMSILNGEQSDKWCEAIYNADGRFKYVDPLINDGNGSYLYAAQGSRKEHRKWWTYNRFLYMDSKYTAGDFLSDYATLRLYTPTDFAGVTPSANFSIIPFADEYVRVKYGSYMVGQRCTKDEPANIVAPDIRFNDTETIVYGASRIKSLGDLSGMYAGTVDVSKATRLSELLIGSGTEGYHNDNLTVLAVGANKMLRKLDIRNCPNLIQSVDLSGCENIEEVYAQGTGVTSVALPAAGILSKLYLPGTVTNLTLKNQPKLLDAFFEIAGVERLSTIISESTPGVNIFPLVDRCLSAINPALSRVRLIGLNGTGPNLSTLFKLTKIGGVDEKGNNVATAVVTGKYHATIAREDQLAAIQAAFPELTVTYTNLKPPTITTFTFSSSQSKAISNAAFECNFDAVKVNEYTYRVIADDDSVIKFTFKCDNHEDHSNTYVVSGTRTQNYSVTYIPLRKIRVKVYDQNVYVSGARVAIGESVYVTDSEGYVSIRSGASITGSVTANGYTGNTFVFSAITNDTTDTVNVYADVEVKFILKNGAGEFAEGFTIECGDRSGTTNIYGECILLIRKGTYKYKLSHIGYPDKTGVVNVGASAMVVTISTPAKLKISVVDSFGIYKRNATVIINDIEKVTDELGACVFYLLEGDYKGVIAGSDQLDEQDFTVRIGTSDTEKTVDVEANIDYYKPEANSNIQVLISPLDDESAAISLEYNTTDFIIDWGDGTTTAAMPDSTYKTYSHEYTDGNVFYQVEILNCEEVKSIRFDRTKENLLAIWSIGNSKVAGISCYYQKIRYICDDIFKNSIEMTSLDGFFKGASSLRNVPSSINNLLKLTNVSNAFNYCGSIKTALPEWWKTYYGKNINKSDCFKGCTSASNWSEVPKSWGGYAPEWHPPFDGIINIKILKDGTWWLNQNVVINSVVFTQLADGSYSARLSGVNVNDKVEVFVNNSPQGTFRIEENKTDYQLLVGDNSSLYSICLDYTTGDLHENSIISNDGWAYDLEVGGLKSKKITHGQSAPLKISVIPGQCVIIFGQDSEIGKDYCTIDMDIGRIYLSNAGSQGDNLKIETRAAESLTFTYIKNGSVNTGKDAFWIKKILGGFTLPDLPADFVPASPMVVSGAVTADIRAMSYRLSRVETALGFND